ncbi:MAG: RnfH family protein [Burkholderiales bacterium]|nr:RnfH family protein [Burkholderiales bacterium]MDE1929030.1 RnfH family protein [Burkholderiales bacterium]MDE2160292.1 RnfH family protein [Burkholderiales bacterium]MDE2501748.1 RnfH family protein [Burkholderiales bacterium]
MARVDAIEVEVVYGPRPGSIDRVALTLAAGATVLDALRASGVLQRHGLVEEGLRIGVWSRACTPEQPLRERDRVEIYRPLLVDPKEARRQRYAAHKARYGGASGRPSPEISSVAGRQPRG